MKIAPLPMLAVLVAFAPLAHGQVAGANHLSLINDEGDIEGIPTNNNFTVSAGGVLIAARANGVSATAYGGYLAGDYFVVKAVSLRVEVIAATASVEGTGVGEIAVDGGMKFYPLQVTDISQCWLQPFVRVAFGDAFYTTTVADSGFNRGSNPLLLAGGGTDFIIGENWSASVGLDYLRTLDSGANAVGLLITAGARYRF
jgi:hypothetical protein